MLASVYIKILSMWENIPIMKVATSGYERIHRIAELCSIVRYEMLTEKVPAEMVRMLFEINEEVNQVKSEMGDDYSE